MKEERRAGLPLRQIDNICGHLWQDSSWPWSHDSWIYSYLGNHCLPPQMLCVRISITAKCTTLCDKVCQWLATGRWFSPGPSASSTNRTDRHDITEILLKVALNTIKSTSSVTLASATSSHGGDRKHFEVMISTEPLGRLGSVTSAWTAINEIIKVIGSSAIPYQPREIHTIYRDIATYKRKVHSAEIEMISVVAKLRSSPALIANLYV